MDRYQNIFISRMAIKIFDPFFSCGKLSNFFFSNGCFLCFYEFSSYMRHASYNHQTNILMICFVSITVSYSLTVFSKNHRRIFVFPISWTEVQRHLNGFECSAHSHPHISLFSTVLTVFNDLKWCFIQIYSLQLFKVVTHLIEYIFQIII